MLNKVIREKLRCGNYVNFSYSKHYKTCWHIVSSAKNTENVNSKLLETKNSITLLSSKCAVSNVKTTRCMKKQEA